MNELPFSLSCNNFSLQFTVCPKHTWYVTKARIVFLLSREFVLYTGLLFSFTFLARLVSLIDCNFQAFLQYCLVRKKLVLSCSSITVVGGFLFVRTWHSSLRYVYITYYICERLRDLLFIGIRELKDSCTVMLPHGNLSLSFAGCVLSQGEDNAAVFHALDSWILQQFCNWSDSCLDFC